VSGFSIIPHIGGFIAGIVLVFFFKQKSGDIARDKLIEIVRCLEPIEDRKGMDNYLPYRI
jgi:hypothetical protein